MSYTPLDDNKLVQMYKSEETVSNMIKKFNVSSGTIYRHLRAKGIDPDRKESIPWTDKEEEQLITAHGEKLTGAELCERIPTRTPASIKSHVRQLRIFKRIGNQKVYKV